MKNINKFTKTVLINFGLIISVFILIVSGSDIQAQTTWNGSMSTDWNDAANWSAGLPSATLNAIIPAAAQAPIIMAGTASARSVTINIGGSLTIDAMATLNIDNSTGNAILTSGSLTNNGTIDIGSLSPITGNGIRALAGTIDNMGTIRINQVGGGAFVNINASITNTGPITIGDIGGIAADGIRNRATFTNFADIRISNPGSNGILCETGSVFSHSIRDLIISGSGSHGFWNQQGDFTNGGRIIISNVVNDADLALRNGGSFSNSNCSVIALSDNLQNTGTIINDGQWYLDSYEPSLAGSFTNNGVVEDIQGTFPTASITNNQVVISKAIVMSPTTITNAFDLGSMFSLTVVGIYTDQTLMTSAGSYDVISNTFTASPALMEGATSLVIVLQDPNNMCPPPTIRVVWNINACLTPCSGGAGVDRCWVGGSGDLWSTPENWCPYGVPLTAEQINIPSGAFVRYDYTGSAIINNLNISTDALLVIDPGYTLHIENDPAKVRTMLQNNGTVSNLGSILLQNGQFRGMLNIGQINNQGRIHINQVDLGSNGREALDNRGTFINLGGARLELSNAKSLGFVNKANGDFRNITGASLIIRDIDGTGMILEDQSIFTNETDAMIDLFNITIPSDKVDIRLGAEVLWNPSVDIN